MLQKKKKYKNRYSNESRKKFDFIQACAKKVSWAMKINFIVYAVMLYKLKHHETPKYN